ncbi:transcription initiation factor TFIID subunit 3 [Maniola jurtina]|uniref:transcription initiation factor TFIID subunit 3 n=1 Tax=Maniola jurtina TaxID=191418 RepID=UPI001E68B310|nr:transcription initiation factor TFIID subunit 3 [Maniola jurtina]
MSEAYAREILRRNVAQICQTIGWNGINSTPLDILVHVLEKYICTLGTQANRYAEQFNRTEPNLHDLGLVFRDLHIQLPELAEYTRSVPPVPPPVRTEKFPKPKESNLNFLKPGSHEVVTRPMHVHEHLPPMYPEKERDTPAVAGTVEIRQNGIDSIETNATCTSPEISVTDSPEKSKDIFKRPIDPVSLPNSKRPRLRLDEEERTREISSVMMTMSGFLSPAREGKLPEAKPPTIISDRHDKHKANSHHSNAMKVPLLDKSDKKSKKNKLLNGKIMKSKRKDKSHKGESSKSRDSNKLNRHPPGYPIKSKDVHPTLHNHVTMPAPKTMPPVKAPMPPPAAPLPPPVVPMPEPLRPVIKQEPVDLPPPLPPPISRPPPRVAEDAIPVPRKIPISKSPLASNSLPLHKPQPATNSLIPEVEIKKEVIEEEEKLASQPDRSKSNIFKRISNKSKEDKNTPEVVPEKLHPQSDAMISRIQNSAPESKSENIRVKSVESIMNNNNSPVNLSREIDIRSHEVISIDDDSLDMHPMPQFRPLQPEPRPTGVLSINKSLQYPFSKDLAGVSPKTKKEKKHREKKDKASKIEAKLKKQQQQLQAFQMVQMAEKKKMKLGNEKPPKPNRPKKDPNLSQLHPGFPFFPAMPHSRGMMSGPGLIPSDLFANIANNPALRGLPPPNLLTNPFALGSAGPGLIPGPSFLPGGLGPGIPNHLMQMGNFPHTSRSSSVKFPQMLRRPSLEVIPVDNEEERIMHKSPMIGRDKDRHDKHKSPTIPNILQKQKLKNKDHKASLYKMPPVQPDITIELNPPKMEPVRSEPPRVPPPPVRMPSPKVEEPAPIPEPMPVPKPEPEKVTIPDIPQEKEPDNLEKKKDKSHKKEKRDKDGLKVKKKKDKKDKNKDKAEKKKDKEERHELKDKIKKEKKEKKKEKVADGLVPKLTLKLSSSNSNSPMPPSSPDIFKLNIKPVVKKEEDDASSLKEEPTSREHSRSPELAQISALVTRPPKQKHSKHNHIADAETPLSPPPASPSRKNRPPSSHSKLKKILFKPMSKKSQVDELDDESVSFSEESAPAPAAAAVDKPGGALPTPYYVDEQGNKIWVCPACGRPDNGSPMIGCDGCDGWYHWVCVGITEEPGATEDWFCKSCLAKRAAMVLAGVTSGKKRGRKPKAEKIRDCH